jgi:DNA helicase HerA-like ATPase
MAGEEHAMTQQRIGVVTSGSLVQGLTVRLTPDYAVERLRVGQYVVIHGTHHRFFATVSDIALEATDRALLSDPPTDDPFLTDVLAGTATYGTVSLRPQLMSPHTDPAALEPPRAVPAHFAPVFEAEPDDFTRVFGAADKWHFEIGQPLDSDIPICIDLRPLVERSNGVFGKSGTGKSFLTRLLLAGVIRADAASNLVFDMHSEYAHEIRAERVGVVKGLRQIFGADRVLLYTLDPDSSRARGAAVDQHVCIGLNQIEPEDVMLLSHALNLSATAAETAFMVQQRYGDRWLRQLLQMDTAQQQELVELGAHPGSLSALRRKLAQLERLPFVVPESEANVLRQLTLRLAGGQHVILEFGRQSSDLAYMLVANILTRHIHQHWVALAETYLRTRRAADQPRQLMITLEEAHKFLEPSLARQTIFGTIARELRKYYVTLLVVDQRPSSIDDEVMSQLGTRISALLNDEKDIAAVFSGVSGASALKAVLATLDSRQQALVLGHAVPMPVAIRTRPYDARFASEMAHAMVPAPVLKVAGTLEDLF